MMEGADAGDVELRIASTRFVEAIAEWRLAPDEVAALLGAPPGDGDPLAGRLNVDAETRLRLVTEVATLLDRMFEPVALRLWLRDDEDGGVTPLAFMSQGPTELRAMRAAISARLL